MKKRVHIYYSGSVQGVGFRFTAERLANSLGLTGWVKNRRDGSVEITAEGEEDKLNFLLEQVEDSFASYIRTREVNWQEATGDFPDFRITF